MFRSLTITSLLLLHCLQFAPTKAEECIDVSNPQTRIFKSLVDLQTNNISFSPQDSNFQGNYVAFENIKIETLPKNSFITYGSSHIEQLLLHNHNIHTIEDGAFSELSCLRYLILQNNKISTLSRGVFANLTKLHELNLAENLIQEIPERAFMDLVRLRKLDISKNMLTVLSADSFFGLSRLEELNLSYNSLTDIPGRTFQYLQNLLYLLLGSNRLEYLELDHWDKLSNLKILNLSHNALECFDTTYQYSFSQNLTELYLDTNALTKLNLDGFKKSLPVLKVISIEDNLWNCKDLENLVQMLKVSKIRFFASHEKAPNVNGIGCNKSAEAAERKKIIHEETSTAPVGTTTGPSKIWENPDPEKGIETRMLTSLKNTQTVIVCLLVAIVMFLMADVAVRCGFLRLCPNRRRTLFLDNSDGEDAVLTERY